MLYDEEVRRKRALTGETKPILGPPKSELGRLRAENRRLKRMLKEAEEKTRKLSKEVGMRNCEERVAREMLEAAHERAQRGKKHPRPFVDRTSGGGIGGRLDPQWHRTYWRRRLMELLGIPVTRRWLRRQ